MARQNGDTHQETYVLTKIKAAELTQVKAKRDTNIIGSTVSGKKVEEDTGRDLHIQSLQDVVNFKEPSKSAGFSVSSKSNFKAPTERINASVGRIDSKWKSMPQKAGIYAGEDGGQSATVGAFDYQASSVTGRPTPVGSFLNYAAMTYESSDINKYGPEGAMSRVSLDLGYSSGMLIGGAYLGPVEVTGVGYLLDYGYNSKKNEMFGPVSEEEKDEQWDRVLNDEHDRLI